jgi:hypothetical protein
MPQQVHCGDGGQDADKSGETDQLEIVRIRDALINFQHCQTEWAEIPR